MNLILHKNGLLSRDPFSFARDFFGDTWEHPLRRSPQGQAVARFAPRFDVKESDDSYVLAADLPGVAESELEISLNGNELTVSGARQAEEIKEGENFHISERSYGAFTRTFVLPDEADAESVEAKLDAGVLRVTIAKRAQAKARKITVRTGPK